MKKVKMKIPQKPKQTPYIRLSSMNCMIHTEIRLYVREDTLKNTILVECINIHYGTDYGMY